ncbi:hypothetical protein D9758_007639 [Tetrapyrgos nigripes]|uniref:F-box domain-containing protein n=1 Tax=Tetrapyrgos nigripes TaxID=182062 RepID=A0A8H5LK14_9AGAR|nr:hypothetical protein D9758_007639 [Tetrapyrgos nigripes]
MLANALRSSSRHFFGLAALRTPLAVASRCSQANGPFSCHAAVFRRTFIATHLNQEDSCKVRLYNLSTMLYVDHSLEEHLLNIAKRFGPVKTLTIPSSKDHCIGFAYATFKFPEDAARFVEEINFGPGSFTIYGKKIRAFLLGGATAEGSDTLFVGNLTDKIGAEDLRKALGSFGEIIFMDLGKRTTLRVSIPGISSRLLCFQVNPTYGYVQFANSEAPLRAIRSHDQDRIRLHGRVLKLDLARPWREKEPNRGLYFSFRGKKVDVKRLFENRLPKVQTINFLPKSGKLRNVRDFLTFETVDDATATLNFLKEEYADDFRVGYAEPWNWHDITPARTAQMSSPPISPPPPSSNPGCQERSQVENLPNEILLLILQYLDFQHILILRETCTLLAEVTKEKIIWFDLLEQQRHVYPLPAQYYEPLSGHLSPSVLDLSSSNIEDLVTSNILIDDLWLVPRQNDPINLCLSPSGLKRENEGDEGEPLKLKQGVLLLGVEMFLDRWVLGVYADGWLNLWDANEFTGVSGHCNCNETGEQGQAWTSCHVSPAGWDRLTSYAATLDAKKEKILIALTKTQLRPNSWSLALYEVNLPPQCSQSPPGAASASLPSFQHRFSYDSSPSYFLRYIDSFSGIVVLSHLCSVQFIRLPMSDEHSEHYTDERQDEQNETANAAPEVYQVATHCDNLEEMYTTIVALRVIDPYLFVCKTRSIELHPIPSPLHGIGDGKQSPSPSPTSTPSSCPSSPPPLPLPVLRHEFPNYNFREIYISEVRQASTSFNTTHASSATTSTSPTSSTTYTLNVFASDVIRGLFYFQVTIVLPALTLSSTSLSKSGSTESSNTGTQTTTSTWKWTYDIEPMLHVKLKAVYALASNIPLRRVRGSSAGPRTSRRFERLSVEASPVPPTSTSTSGSDSNSSSTASTSAGTNSSIPSLSTGLSRSNIPTIPSHNQRFLLSSQLRSNHTNIPHALRLDISSTSNSNPRTSRTPTDTNRFHHHHLLSPSRDASFVSTYTMGLRGLRAIWIERRSATMVKRVVGCHLGGFDDDTDDEDEGWCEDLGVSKDEKGKGKPRANTESGEEGVGDKNNDDKSVMPPEGGSSSCPDEAANALLPLPLDGKVVYSLHSYDLREDLTHCALGEASGTIVLGNRSGDVFLLDIGV